MIETSARAAQNSPCRVYTEHTHMLDIDRAVCIDVNENMNTNHDDVIQICKMRQAGRQAGKWHTHTK